MPFIVTDQNVKLREGGILADMAPTILKLMDIAAAERDDGKADHRQLSRKLIMRSLS